MAQVVRVECSTERHPEGQTMRPSMLYYGMGLIIGQYDKIGILLLISILLGWVVI